MLDVFAGGLVIGVLVGAPIGPIGTACLIHMTAGRYRPAFAGMAGCLAAEMALVLVAVLATTEFVNYLTGLPRLAETVLGIALAAIGLYLIFSERAGKMGGVASFIVAFKITVLSPNNLLALTTLIAALGFAGRLTDPFGAAAFIFGDIAGASASWACVLWLGWLLRGSRAAETIIRWLRRVVGTVMILAGAFTVVRRF